MFSIKFFCCECMLWALTEKSPRVSSLLASRDLWLIKSKIEAFELALTCCHSPTCLESSQSISFACCLWWKCSPLSFSDMSAQCNNFKERSECSRCIGIFYDFNTIPKLSLHSFEFWGCFCLIRREVLLLLREF